MTKINAIKYLERLRNKKRKRDMNKHIDYAIKCIHETSLEIYHISFDSKNNFIVLWFNGEKYEIIFRFNDETIISLDFYYYFQNLFLNSFHFNIKNYLLKK